MRRCCSRIISASATPCCSPCPNPPLPVTTACREQSAHNCATSTRFSAERPCTNKTKSKTNLQLLRYFNTGRRFLSRIVMCRCWSINACANGIDLLEELGSQCQTREQLQKLQLRPLRSLREKQIRCPREGSLQVVGIAIRTGIPAHIETIVHRPSQFRDFERIQISSYPRGATFAAAAMQCTTSQRI